MGDKKQFKIDGKFAEELAKVIKKHGVNEIEISQENSYIKVSKAANNVVTSVVAQDTNQAMVAPVAVEKPHAEPTIEKSADAEDDYTANPNALKSPMVGTVYLSPSPEDDNYVKVGSKVSEGDTLLLIEAMKVFSPVKAHKEGIVRKILVENSSPVEFGEPLVVIE